jgi:hypothetical protein
MPRVVCGGERAEHSKWLTREPITDGRMRLPWARPAYVGRARTGPQPGR